MALGLREELTWNTSWVWWLSLEDNLVASNLHGADKHRVEQLIVLVAFGRAYLRTPREQHD